MERLQLLQGQKILPEIWKPLPTENLLEGTDGLLPPLAPSPTSRVEVGGRGGDANHQRPLGAVGRCSLSLSADVCSSDDVIAF